MSTTGVNLTSRSHRMPLETALAEGLAAVAGRLPPADAARVLIDALVKERTCSGRDGSWVARGRLAESLAPILLGVRGSELENAWSSTVFSVGSLATPHHLIPCLWLLHLELDPKLQPLTPQALVEVLKCPLIVGSARRAVLDALEVTYNRPFKDQWEFVEYAQKHQPQLDLLTPPKRPQP